LNVHSNDEIRSYVYGTLELEPWKFTKNGAPSVDSTVLSIIDDPVVNMIVDYKSLTKERSTYTNSYVDATRYDNRIHSEFKQTRTATGRLSSGNPNLQNVVKDGDMRKLFVAEEGNKLIRMDYSQLELRVFAALTQAESMIKAFKEGRNIHQETADTMGVAYKDAKVINFLMLYGGTAWAISRQFQIPIDEAKEMLAKYFRAFPEIKKYITDQEYIANAEKKVTNYFGRVRRLDAMYSNNYRIRKEGEREAVNTPIQGAACDVVKLGMINLHQKFEAPMILQVHDELVFEVPEKEAVEYAHWLKEYVPTITEINGMQFPVEVGVGRTWQDAGG